MTDTPVIGKVVQADNLEVLRSLPSASVDLVYVDPPFNTGNRRQRLARLKTTADPEGSRVGFQGKRYRSTQVSNMSYVDAYEDYTGFLLPRVIEIRRVLKPTGSLYFHIDYRESHYCKVMLDQVFGRQSFLNEIIWSYDYGARATRKWPAKHDNILLYVKDPENYYFDLNSSDRIPYMAPGMVGPEKAARGKTPTDVWWQTIVPTNGKERTGYPTQKPVQLLRRIVKVSCPPGGLVADFFAGSGTTGQAVLDTNWDRDNGLQLRSFFLVDSNPEAVEVMRRRFDGYGGVTFNDSSLPLPISGHLGQ